MRISACWYKTSKPHTKLNRHIVLRFCQEHAITCSFQIQALPFFTHFIFLFENPIWRNNHMLHWKCLKCGDGNTADDPLKFLWDCMVVIHKSHKDQCQFSLRGTVHVVWTSEPGVLDTFYQCNKNNFNAFYSIPTNYCYFITLFILLIYVLVIPTLFFKST